MDITIERMYTCELRIVTMLDIKVHEETRVSLSLYLKYLEKEENELWVRF